MRWASSASPRSAPPAAARTRSRARRCSRTRDRRRLRRDDRALHRGLRLVRRDAVAARVARRPRRTRGARGVRGPFDENSFTAADWAALQGAGPARRGRHARGPGRHGRLVDDDVAFARPWGFEVARSRRRSCSPRASRTGSSPHPRRELLRALPDAELWLRRNDGHVSILNATAGPGLARERAPDPRDGGGRAARRPQQHERDREVLDLDDGDPVARRRTRGHQGDRAELGQLGQQRGAAGDARLDQRDRRARGLGRLRQQVGVGAPAGAGGEQALAVEVGERDAWAAPPGGDRRGRRGPSAWGAARRCAASRRARRSRARARRRARASAAAGAARPAAPRAARPRRSSPAGAARGPRRRGRAGRSRARSRPARGPARPSPPRGRARRRRRRRARPPRRRPAATPRRAVSRTSRVVRSSSVTPSSRSSSPTVRETVCWVMCSSSAARVKLSCSATAANTRRWRSSGIHPPSV